MHVDVAPFTVQDALTVLPSTLSAHTSAAVTPSPQRNDQHVVETDQWHAVVHQPRNTTDISVNDAQKIKNVPPLSPLPPLALASYLVVEETSY